MLRRIVILVMLGLCVAEARAQFVPPPPVAIPVLVPNGIGFSYRSSRLRVGGFLGNGTYSLGTLYPYGVPPYGVPPVLVPNQAPFLYMPPYQLPLSSSIDYRINFNYILPNVILSSRPPLTPSYDLSGVDLDAVPAKMAGAEKAPEVKVAKLEVARPAPAPEPAKVAAKPEPAKVEVARVPQRELPKVEPPRVDTFEECQRLVELGQTAFREGNFGVAAQRFVQARDVEPRTARPYLYLVQAYFALGKYDEAVDALQLGLTRRPEWPHSTFQPTLDFYRGLPADWKAHRQALEASLKRQPKEANLAILLGHQLWFEGDRDGALALFRRAPDSPIAQVFLKAAEPVAAK